MELTVEQVEKVRRYAQVSFEEAKAALEQAGGSPLDAVILLERQGKVPPPQGGAGAWSTKLGTPPPEEEPAAPGASVPAKRPRPKRRKYTSKEVGDAIKSFLRNCTKISVDIWRGDDLLVGIPLIVCVLLFIVAPYVMIPLAILGLIVRCRYHFSGWEWNTDTINRAMDQVTETVADWTEQFKQELRDYHNRRGGTSNKK